MRRYQGGQVPPPSVERGQPEWRMLSRFLLWSGLWHCPRHVRGYTPRPHHPVACECHRPVPHATATVLTALPLSLVLWSSELCDFLPSGVLVLPWFVSRLLSVRIVRAGLRLRLLLSDVPLHSSCGPRPRCAAFRNMSVPVGGHMVAHKMLRGEGCEQRGALGAKVNGQQPAVEGGDWS